MSTIACIGGAHIDRHGMLRAPMVLGTSNPGAIRTSLGGVARNVAQNLTALGCSVLLCSRAGADEAGREVLAQPLDTSLITISQTRPTATYTAVLEPDGELVIGLADMDVYEEITPEVLAPALRLLVQADLWFVDANLPEATIDWLVENARVPVAADAISVAKSRRLVPVLPRLSYLFCNLAQAGALARESFSGSQEAAEAMMAMGTRAGIVSAGAKGIAVYHGEEVSSLPALAATPRDVTGAGDALVAGTLFGLLQNLDLCAAARLGLAAAAIAVESDGSTATALTREALYART